MDLQQMLAFSPITSDSQPMNPVQQMQQRAPGLMNQFEINREFQKEDDLRFGILELLMKNSQQGMSDWERKRQLWNLWNQFLLGNGIQQKQDYQQQRMNKMTY